MHALKLSALIALVILEVGCGLPSPYYLSPPNVLQSFGLSTPTCTIQNANRANDYQASFEGFELYYKIYGSTLDSSFSADQQYGTISYSPTDLSNHGFLRVTLGPGTVPLPIDTTPGSASAPLININKIDPSDAPNTFSIQIFLNDSSVTLTDPNPVSYYTYIPSTGNIRNPNNLPGNPKIRRGQSQRSAGAAVQTVCKQSVECYICQRLSTDRSGYRVWRQPGIDQLCWWPCRRHDVCGELWPCQQSGGLLQSCAPSRYDSQRV